MMFASWIIVGDKKWTSPWTILAIPMGVFSPENIFWDLLYLLKEIVILLVHLSIDLFSPLALLLGTLPTR